MRPAIATVRVPTHPMLCTQPRTPGVHRLCAHPLLGAAIYVLQAVHRAANACEADAAVAGKRERQFRHLLGLLEVPG